MKTLIIGMGEVGNALYEILSPVHETSGLDLEESYVPDGIEIMHVCIRHDNSFLDIVRGYIKQYRPRLVDICSTVPPGTTKQLGDIAVHSTTRGLHPNLVDGIRVMTKHIGGPRSKEVAEYFEAAGIRCRTHNRPETTELAHLLSNALYGVNILFADEMARICRNFGVDYYEAVMLYNESNNEGYRKLDHTSKCRMIITPPNGSIGGHCVSQNARILSDMLRDKEVPSPLVDMVAGYGK